MVRILLSMLLLLFIIVAFWQFTPASQLLSVKTISRNLPSALTQPSEKKDNLSESKKINPLTLDKIFEQRKDFSNLDPEKVITIIATGDVIPARSVNYQTTQRNNFLWPFEKTADVLKNADITFINLETPLMKNCQLMNEGMRFCGSSKHIEGLTFAGVDIANLANNHSANYGKIGIDETKKLLDENGILVTGLNGPVYKDTKGVRFAFLGFNDIEKSPLVSNADENKIKTEIEEAAKNSDIVIVQYHWGAEYLTAPEDRQRFLGKLSIDSGADLVIGNHPHWIKPIEFYKNKIITYGHGNFIFDQEWSQKTKEGVVGKYTYYEFELIDVEYLPIEIINFGQPYFLENERKQKILDEMYNESKAILK